MAWKRRAKKPGKTKVKNAKKSVYDGRTKEGRKFVERILARRAAREASKKIS